MRKEKLRRIGSAAAAWLLVLGMVGCQKAPAEPTDDALLAVTTEATKDTQPEATEFVSSSRYQATLPPEPEKPTEPATQPTEPAVTEETDTGDTSSGSSGSGYTPAPTEAPAPAPTEAPAPVETAPPATEAPTEAPVTVSYDYNAAAAYGNSYAASTYGWIVDSSVEGYYPAGSISLQDAANNGGQSYINSWMASVVDSTYWSLSQFGSTAGCAVWCDCWESDGWIYFVVYYG